MKIIGVWVNVFLLFFLYFAPTMVAYKHRQVKSIFVVNLFLGWTLIGWCFAFSWASIDNKK